MNNEINREIAINIDNLLDTSENIKQDVSNLIDSIVSRFHVAEKDVKDAVKYHTLNITRYNQQFVLADSSFVN